MTSGVNQGTGSTTASGGGFKLFTIPLDLIPLNWCKMPQTKYIFQIISICFGPYNTKGTLEVDTASLFQKIHDLAVTASQISGSMNPLLHMCLLNKNETQLAQQIVHRQRLRSVILNNQAVQMYLNVPDIESENVRAIKLSRVSQLFQEACQISP